MDMSKVNLSPEALERLLNVMLEKKLEAIKAEYKENAIVKAKDANVQRREKNEIAIAKAFQAAGFKGIELLAKDRSNIATATIMTQNIWHSQGFKLKANERYTKVRGVPYRLYHKSQVVELHGEDRQKLLADHAAKVKAWAAAGNKPQVIAQGVRQIAR